jgi:hypothetical protein
MTPRGLFIATLAVALLNGWISPAKLPVAVLVVPIWTPAFVPLTEVYLSYAATIVISAATLLLAGVPTAIVERVRGQAQSDHVSMVVWLVGAVLLTLPGLPYLIAAS